ncbi:MAG TPA: hypothetical protein PKD12_19475 [Nitrospira sp.]|nr:hypothetical protein [Nitrospira sp.]
MLGPPIELYQSIDIFPAIYAMPDECGVILITWAEQFLIGLDHHAVAPRTGMLLRTHGQLPPSSWVILELPVLVDSVMSAA